MKIGIITFHNALNAGAVLQAYALQTFLQQQGHTVEFINYCPPKHYTFRDFIAKSPSVMFNKWKDIYNEKIYSKRRDFNKVLHMGKVYTSIEELKKNPPIYDVYIAGSDQIWNFYTQLQPVYLLSFVPKDKKKIAYAASMGQCQLSENIYEAFKEHLLQFDAISIREKNGTEFVQHLMGNQKEIVQVLDPTLLISKENYTKIADTTISNKQPYICSYILAHLDNEDKKIISYIQQRTGKCIINLRNPSTCIRLRGAKNKIVNPYQWLSYVNQSDFMICSSFHAVVFSLILHKPFIAVVPSISKSKGGNMRINSLLDSVGLSDRIISYYNQTQIDQLISLPIDWNKIDKRTEELRVTSINFLLNSLN